MAFRLRAFLKLIAPALLGGVIRVAPPACADEDKRGLGPGLFTYPEIAAALSDRCHAVQCAPTLAHRVAFVSLRKRTWSQISKLLTDGLDVRLRPDKPTEPNRERWILEPNPVSAAREDKWLTQFLRNVAVALQAWWNSFTPYLSQPLAQIEAAELANDVAVKSQTADQDPDKIRKAIPLLESGLRLSAATHNTTPGARMTLEWAQASTEATLARAYRTGSACEIVSPQRFKPEWFSGATQNERSRAVQFARLPNINPPLLTVPAYDAVAATFTFQRSMNAYDVTPQLALLAPEGRALPCESLLNESVPPNHNSTDWVRDIFAGLPTDDSTLLMQFKPFGLGVEASAWLDVERAETARFLQSDLAKKPIALPTVPYPDALSQFIEEWSRTQNVETIMELWPERDDWYSTRVGGYDYELNGSEEQMAAWLAQKPRSLADVLSPTNPWSLRLHDGVLLVQNQLAFLDRVPMMPRDGWLACSRLREKKAALKSGNVKTELPPMTPNATLPPDTLTETEIAAYARASASGDYQRWEARLPDPHRYRNVELDTLDSALPAWYVWTHCRPEERNQVGREETSGTVVLSFARFSPETLHTLTMILRAFGSLNVQSWHPDFERALAASAVTVRWRRLEGEQARFLLAFDFGRDADHKIRTIHIQNADALFIGNREAIKL